MKSESGVDVQGLVRDVWGEVLGLTSADDEDDFFLLGGDSLLAVELIEDLEGRLGIELSMAGFFEDARLATLIRDCQDRSCKRA